MQLIQLKEELSDSEIVDIVGNDAPSVIVTNYETGCYDGSGEALVLRGDVVEYWYLGHCSYYIPTDVGASESMAVEEFLATNADVTGSWGDKIAAAFIEAAGMTPVDPLEQNPQPSV